MSRIHFHDPKDVRAIDVRLYFCSFHHYLPGDSTFCRWFRTTNDYYKDKRFVNILDIAVLDYLMLSYDSKDNYIINDKNVTVNIFIDRGKS